MPPPPTIHVGKLDAARRQMEVAVRPYFSESDPVSIHTLASAAHQILTDINKARGGPPTLKEQVPSWVAPAAADEVRRRLNEAANFFKHADRDHADMLEFTPAQTELLLFDAVEKYRELACETTPVLAA